MDLLHQIAYNLLPKSVQGKLRSIHYHYKVRWIAPEADAVACLQFIKPGDTVIDLGANVGLYSKVFADHDAEVHAVEPIPETFRYLASNMRNRPNVHCYNLAVSDCTGVAHMEIPQWHDGGDNIYEARISQAGDITVRTSTLDDLFPKLTPALIKCDVEGHELAVLRGAQKMLARCRPVWLLEVSSQQTIDAMEVLGYSASPATGENMFFLPKNTSTMSR